MKTVILVGGCGTRISEENQLSAQAHGSKLATSRFCGTPQIYSPYDINDFVIFGCRLSLISTKSSRRDDTQIQDLS